jgi:hypothetical protein
MADMWWPTIRAGCCDVRSAYQNRHAPQFPLGYYCAVEVTGPKAIMTTILNHWDAAQRKSRGSRESRPRF